MVSMEFVDGTTLAELLAEKGPLDLSRAGEIAGQLLAGLEAIHAAGFVHRDLKPENVMLTLSKRVVVMDFGIARSLTRYPGWNHCRDARVHVSGAGGRPSRGRARRRVLGRRGSGGDGVVAGGREPTDQQRQTQAVGGAAGGPASGSGRTVESRCSAGRWAVRRRDRYPSAGALARALEIQQRETGRAEQSPYPGPSAFHARGRPLLLRP